MDVRHATFFSEAGQFFDIRVMLAIGTKWIALSDGHKATLAAPNGAENKMSTKLSQYNKYPSMEAEQSLYACDHAVPEVKYSTGPICYVGVLIKQKQT